MPVKLAGKVTEVTGKVFSLLGGWRLERGIGLLTWYRMTGKMQA